MSQIVGFVDAVTGPFVQGWIVNTAHPERLERVVCHGNGQSLAFRAFMPRADVCVAMKLTGRFGFAIPTAALRILGPVIRLTTAAGAPLENGEAVHPGPVPPPAGPPRPTVVMLHIQKTAGTSLRLSLATAAQPGEILFVYPDGFNGISEKEMGELSSIQLAALRLVMGHARFGFADCLPNRIDYATILREPLARLRSHYYHHMSAGGTYELRDSILPTSLVVQHCLTDEFDNLAVRVLTGLDGLTAPIRMLNETHVEQALDNIRNRFRYVALTEQLDAQFGPMCEVLGLEAAPLAVHNVRRTTEPEKLDAMVDWDEVMHHNRLDVLLYERVQAEGLVGRDLRRLRAVPKARAAGT